MIELVTESGIPICVNTRSIVCLVGEMRGKSFYLYLADGQSHLIQNRLHVDSEAEFNGVDVTDAEIIRYRLNGGG